MQPFMDSNHTVSSLSGGGDEQQNIPVHVPPSGGTMAGNGMGSRDSISIDPSLSRFAEQQHQGVQLGLHHHPQAHHGPPSGSSAPGPSSSHFSSQDHLEGFRADSSLGRSVSGGPGISVSAFEDHSGGAGNHSPFSQDASGGGQDNNISPGSSQADQHAGNNNFQDDNGRLQAQMQQVPTATGIQPKRSQRPSWSCTECTRRKIKCDKVIPCKPCTKRKRAHECHLEPYEPRITKHNSRNLASNTAHRLSSASLPVTLTSPTSPPSGLPGASNEASTSSAVGPNSMPANGNPPPPAAHQNGPSTLSLPLVQQALDSFKITISHEMAHMKTTVDDLTKRVAFLEKELRVERGRNAGKNSGGDEGSGSGGKGGGRGGGGRKKRKGNNNGDESGDGGGAGSGDNGGAGGGGGGTGNGGGDFNGDQNMGFDSGNSSGGGAGGGHDPNSINMAVDILGHSSDRPHPATHPSHLQNNLPLPPQPPPPPINGSNSLALSLPNHHQMPDKRKATDEAEAQITLEFLALGRDRRRGFSTATGAPSGITDTDTLKEEESIVNMGALQAHSEADESETWENDETANDGPVSASSTFSAYQGGAGFGEDPFAPQETKPFETPHAQYQAQYSSGTQPIPMHWGPESQPRPASHHSITTIPPPQPSSHYEYHPGAPSYYEQGPQRRFSGPIQNTYDPYRPTLDHTPQSVSSPSAARRYSQPVSTTQGWPQTPGSQFLGGRKPESPGRVTLPSISSILPVSGEFPQTGRSRSGRAPFVDLLPTREQSIKAVDWALRETLWQHACVHAPTFRREVEDFLSWGERRLRFVNHSWLALFWAVLCVGIRSMTDDEVLQNGFQPGDNKVLPQKYYAAVHEALALADWMSNHSIFTCQAIGILTTCCHDIGGSDGLGPLLGAGIKIAQALNLHCMGKDSDWRSTPEGASAGAKQLIAREVRKRVWWALVIQDWFNIPYRRSHSVHVLQFDTDYPGNCHDEDLAAGISEEQHRDIPTVACKIRTQAQISGFVRKYFDLLAKRDGLSDPLKVAFDAAMEVDGNIKDLIRDLPAYLKPPNEHEAYLYPLWVRWMRHQFRMGISHKIIIVHRHLLHRAFTDSSYTYSREACTSAARTILVEFTSQNTNSHRPLWQGVYFCLAASTIVLIELLHDTPSRPVSDADGKRNEVIAARDCLRQIESTSGIAKRGIQLITHLLEEEAALHQGRRHGSRSSSNSEASLKRLRLEEEARFPQTVGVHDGRLTAFPMPNGYRSESEELSRFEPQMTSAELNDYLKQGLPAHQFGQSSLDQKPFQPDLFRAADLQFPGQLAQALPVPPQTSLRPFQSFPAPTQDLLFNTLPIARPLAPHLMSSSTPTTAWHARFS